MPKPTKQLAKRKLPKRSTEGVVPPFAANPEAPTIYASSMQVLVSSFDFMLFLGLAGYTVEGFHLRHVGTVILAPGHAKVLATILGQKVAEYEELNGPISLASGPQTAQVALLQKS